MTVVGFFIWKIADSGNPVIAHEDITGASGRATGDARAIRTVNKLDVFNKECHAYLLYNKNMPGLKETTAAFVDDAVDDARIARLRTARERGNAKRNVSYFYLCANGCAHPPIIFTRD